MRLLDDIAVDHDIRGRGIRAGRLCRPPEPDFRVGVDRHALFKGKRGPLIGGRTVKRQFADLIGGAAAGILAIILLIILFRRLQRRRPPKNPTLVRARQAKKDFRRRYRKRHKRFHRKNETMERR